MGHVVERGNSYRAVCRRKGTTATETFKTKTLAKAWVAKTEHEWNTKGVPVKDKRELTHIVMTYRTDVVEKRPYKTQTPFHLKTFEKQFAGVTLGQCDTAWWFDMASAWRITPATRMGYLSTLRSAFKATEILLKYKFNWTAFNEAYDQLKFLGLVKSGKPRIRRLKPGELDAVRRCLDTNAPMVDIIDFALATAMRVGELCRITWADFHDGPKPMLWVRDRKHPKDKIGNDFYIPLLTDAADIIRRQPVADERIFPWSPGTIGADWGDAVTRAGIKDLVFHDLRHEGISRLFEAGYGIPEVALVSGHKSWECLRIYVNLYPEKLHDGPLSHTSQKGLPEPRVIPTFTGP